MPYLKRGGGALRMTAIAIISFVVFTTSRETLYRRSEARNLNDYRRVDSMRISGKQLVMVYIGSARCHWCQDKRLPGYLAAAQRALRLEANEQGARLVTIGIAVDVLKDEGIGYLNKVGSFEEIISGGGWVGEGAVHFIWRGLGMPAATPQILVLRRSLNRDSLSGGEVIYNFGDETLIARKIGLPSIGDWVESGAPIIDITGSNWAKTPVSIR